MRIYFNIHGSGSSSYYSGMYVDGIYPTKEGMSEVIRYSPGLEAKGI